MKIQLLLFLSLIFHFSFVEADLPKNGLVMVDFPQPYQLTSKAEPGFKTINFEELVSTGINGIHFKVFADLGYVYTYAEWVKEAHEYGLWVCGGISSSKQEQMVTYAKQLALEGVDFIQLDFPFEAGNACNSWNDPFGETEFLEVKNAAGQLTSWQSCPVIITDMACDNIYMNWNSLDGVLQYIVTDALYNNFLPKAETYKANWPGKFAGAWVWLTGWQGFDSIMVTDTQFETWFEGVYNRLGNVVLNGWNHRQVVHEGVYGTNWEHRVNTFKRVIGKGEPAPEWSGFSPSALMYASSPDCQVNVRCARNGLDPATVECFYAVDPPVNFNTRWLPHKDITVTGVKGTKDWITITAHKVPFNRLGAANKIMFKVTNTYEKNWYRNAQVGKKVYDVNIEKLDWQNISNNGEVNGLPAALSVELYSVQKLDLKSVESEYSTDGGNSWMSHPAVASSVSGSADRVSIAVKDVPLMEGKPGANKIRFAIKTTGGALLQSRNYPIQVKIPPVIKDLTTIRTNDRSINFSFKVHDQMGVRIGSYDVFPDKESMLLLHLNGTSDDVSVNGYTNSLSGDAGFVEADTWKSKGGIDSVLYLDGDGDVVDYGYGTLGRSNTFTVSARVKAENGFAAIAFGGIEEYDNLQFSFSENQAIVQATSVSGTIVPNILSPPGSFSYGEWYHVALSFNGGTAKLYINGNPVAAADWSDYQLFRFKPFLLGRPANRPYFFKGYLDEVHLINRCLTDAEIAAEYYSGMYRVTTDGGAHWGLWQPFPPAIKDGTQKETTLFLYGVSLPEGNDSLNKIQFAVADTNGNVTDVTYMLVGNDVQSAEKIPRLKPQLTVYPNPFSHKLTIDFSLEEPKLVLVDIFDVNAHLVMSIRPGVLGRGRRSLSWDGRGTNNIPLGAGRYIARIRLGKRVISKKIMLLNY
ncbi:MAG: T9SS type A sorting domain-containing protein [Fibrobacteria bacterium]|nr:T9SS type A sorting domain-containing protein [Fibrobacteria bacterium]